MNNTPPCRFDLTFIILGIQNLSSIKPINCVEIGSRDGYDTNFISNHFHIPSKNCIIFEPNPNSCQEIIQNYPQFQTFNNAISSTVLTKELYINENNIGNCSLLKKTDSTQNSIKVDCIDMKSVISNLNLTHIDICKIYTEGTTLDVLKSFGEKIDIVKSIQLESEIKTVWEGQSLYSDVKLFLQNNNFIEVLFCRLGDIQIESFWIHKNYINGLT